MSNPIRKYNIYEYETIEQYSTPKNPAYSSIRQQIKPKPKKKRAKKKLIPLLFALALLSAYGYFVCPYNFKQYFEPLFLNRFLNKNIKLDIKPYVFPTEQYAHNSFFFGQYQLTPRAQKAKEIILGIVLEPEIGERYTGTVVRLMQFGAFVELTQTVDGMIHISKLSSKRVERVEDVVNIGDRVEVEVIKIDERGRVDLKLIKKL